MASESFPHTHLFPGATTTVVISGPHIQVLSSPTGALLRSTAADDFDPACREAVLGSGPVRCAAVDAEFVHLVTVGDDKRMKLWKLDRLEVLSERELPKKPMQVLFTRDGQTVLVADKFGDVFSYPLHPVPNPVGATTDNASEEQTERDLSAPHENASGGSLVLGHTSLLTSCLLTPSEKYIVTADRDEHIRVSWYPLGYCIESYCLGHKKLLPSRSFVSAIHIPSFAPDTLLSGGGDPAIYRWDWLTGRPVGQLPILEVVRPFIKIFSKKRKRGEDDEDGEEDGEGRPKAKKLHGRRGRANKQSGVEGGGDVEMEEGDVGRAETPTAQAGASTSPVPTSDSPTEPPEPTLALKRILTLDVDGKRTILFSAVGATAIFVCPYESSDACAITFRDFGRPVLDIVAAQGDGQVWVLLDAHWTDPVGSGPAGSLVQAVKLVRIMPETVTEVDPSASPLLRLLNSQCLIEASDSARAALDLYADLTALPKNVDVAHDPMVRTDKKNAKEAGKRRTRELLQAAQNGSAAASDQAVVGEAAKDSAGANAAPESKKQRSEGDA
ncbi:WD40-repeat-containing domain protein [Vararia minispora EC-137]|uniref:WD40-repeat-containing domain protein n=1 Tax=Vararia minispora EC-137 TaxID=1314806 RepID=A0ACB8QQG3_9AGAM|nr:WD40-repeat-containing domain protein [Vararia minispora EC-137]